MNERNKSVFDRCEICGPVAMHSIDCRGANLDRNKNSYYLVQILRLWRPEKIDHTLSING